MTLVTNSNEFPFQYACACRASSMLSWKRHRFGVLRLHECSGVIYSLILMKAFVRMAVSPPVVMPEEKIFLMVSGM